MLELSEKAQQELTSFFASQPNTEKNIRIYSAMSCGGPRLTMALDTPNDQDEVETISGMTFCMEKSLLNEVKSVKVDVSYMGFEVEPEVPLPVPEGMGGGCGSCCGCH